MSEQATTYAKALMQFGAEEWVKQLTAVQHRLWQHPGTVELLSDPNAQPSERQRAVRALISSDMRPEVVRLIELVVQHGGGGIRALGEIISALREQVEGLGTVGAEVTSAMALSDEEKRRVEAKLRADYGEELRVVYEVNPELLGGLLIRVGDRVMDYTVAARFNALRERIVG